MELTIGTAVSKFIELSRKDAVEYFSSYTTDQINVAALFTKLGKTRLRLNKRYGKSRDVLKSETFVIPVVKGDDSPSSLNPTSRDTSATARLEKRKLARRDNKIKSVCAQNEELKKEKKML